MGRLWKLLLLSLWIASVPAQSDLAKQLYWDALHILGGNANVVSKWQGQIRFAVIDDAGRADVINKANVVVSEASGIAGLPLLLAEKSLSSADFLAQLRQLQPHLPNQFCDDSGEQCFNFVVAVTNPGTMLTLAEAIPLRPVYSQALRNSPEIECFFAPYHTGPQRIVQAVVYIREDLPKDLLNTCLQEEIYQSFGLYNDASGSTLFSFNNVVAPKTITQYDKTLLKALYTAEVKPGYPVAMVVEIFLKSLGLPE